MSDKIKPCPFCGSNNIYIYKACGVGCDDAWIECLECGTKTKAFRDVDEAIEEWNRRVEPTFTPDELDAIRRNVRGNCVLLVREFSKIEQSIIDKCNDTLKGVRDDTGNI